LADNQGFEVRMWPRGATPEQFVHFGAAAPVRSTRLIIDISATPAVRQAGRPPLQGGAGAYWWTVAVVQLQPYERTGVEATPRVLNLHFVP
jgi:hypothetical protein